MQSSAIARVVATVFTVTLLAACGEGKTADDPIDLKSTMQGYGEPGAGNGTVQPGGRCETNADCAGAAVCLQMDPDGYELLCSPPCTERTAQDDCAVFRDNHPHNPVLDAQDSDNAWNARYLERGVFCVEVTSEDGTFDGQSFCGFGCPRDMAVVYTSCGTIDACACRPGYLPYESIDACYRNEAFECGVGIACTEDNTEVHPCSEGRFTCFVNDHLEGSCKDVVSDQALAACGVAE